MDTIKTPNQIQQAILDNPVAPAIAAQTDPIDKSTQTDDGGDPKPSRVGVFAFLDQVNNKTPQQTDSKPTITPGFSGAQGNFNTTEKDNSIDLTSYRPYLDNPNPQDSNLDINRAKAQPWYEQAAHSAGQFLTGATGGFMQALGTNLDVKSATDVLTSTEQDYGNALTQAGGKLIESGQESMPIYEQQPGKFAPGDPAWWFNQLGQSGTMVGMAAEATVETAGITALTEGTGAGEAIGSLGSKIAKLSTLEGLTEAVKNSTQLKNSAVMFGLINRHNMGMMAANQAGEDEYKSLIQRGYSENDAKKFAAKAASATYLSNVPLVALDIMGFRAMTFNPLTQSAEGGLADSILENTIGHISNPLGKTAAILGIEAAKGGVEADWQYLSSSLGKSYADRMASQSSGHPVGEGLNDYFKTQDLLNTGASGIIGGLITGGLFKGYEQMTQGRAKNAMDEEYKTFIDGMASTHLELADKISEATKSGNEDEANILRRQLGINKALAAVHLDQMQGKTDAFNSYKSYFSNLLSSATSGDEEALGQMGLQGHADFLKDQIPQYLADADHIKAIYNDVKEYNKPDAVIPITYRRFLIDNLNEELTKTNGAIVTTEAGIPDLSNLSASAKITSDSKLQKMLFGAQEENATRALQTETDPIEKANLQGIIDHSKNAQDYHQGLIDQNAEATGKYTDADISKSVEGNFRLRKLNEQKVDLETSLTGLRKQLNLWQDKDFQSKKSQEQFNDIINKADSTQDIERIRQALEGQGRMTTELAQKISDKKKVLAVKEETETLKNKTSDNNPVNTGVSPLLQTVQKTGDKTPPSPEQPQKDINPFGKTLSPTAEDNKIAVLNDERVKIAKEVLPRIEPVSNENKTATIVKDDTKDLFSNPEPTNPNATIIDVDSLFDPAKVNVDSLTDEKKGGIKDKLSDYIKSLAGDLGKQPDFKDLVEDFVNHTTKQDTEKNFNLLKLGWELNGKSANFDQVYNDVFSDRKSKGLGFFDYGSDILTTEEELTKTNQTLEDNQDKRDSSPVQTKQTESGRKVFMNISPYQTVEPTLKLAHLSLPYIRTMTEGQDGITRIDYKYDGDELNQGQYVNSKELMNPNLWGTGTTGHISIPEGADDILIANWGYNYEKLEPVKFSEWAKDKDKTSDEYIGRIPMIIHNDKGEGVAFVHDTQWYNPTNVGMVDTPETQAKTIQDAKDEILALKKSVLAKDGKLDIEVTEKRPGTKYTIPKDKPLLTIKEANPQAKIGYVNDTGNVVTGSGVVNFGSLLNKEDLQRGHQYDVRQAGIDENGKPTYFAAKMLYDKIDGDAKMSIIQALRVYASQADTGEKLSSKSEIDRIRKEVLSHTKLDLFDKGDIEKYLNMFIPTSRDKASNEQDVYNNIESNPNIINQTPFIAVQKGAIVFGIKGMNIDGLNTVNYFYPGMLKGTNPDKAASLINSMLQRMYKDDFLGQMKQNMDGDSLGKNREVAHILYNNGETNITPAGKYEDYLKGKLKTNIKSFDLGDGQFATFIQPVIHYDYDRTEDATSGEKTKGVIPKSTSDIKEIKDIFQSNDKLKTIGTSNEYSKYLDTIFPNSKVDDIVFHGSKNKDIEQFDKKFLGTGEGYLGFGEGFYFGTNKELINNDYSKEGKTYSVLLDINKNLGWLSKANDNLITKLQSKYPDLDISNTDTNGTIYEKLTQSLYNYKYDDDEFSTNKFGFKPASKTNEVFKSLGYDSITNENSLDNKGQLIVFEPDQVHILGSKEDVQKFKNWKDQNINKGNIFDIVNKVAKDMTGITPENHEQKLLEDITGSLDQFKNLGLSDEAMKALQNLPGVNKSDKLFDPNYAALTDDIVRSVKTKLTKIEDLDTIDRSNVVSFIANQVMSKIDPQTRNSIDKKELIADVTKSFQDIIQPKLDLVDSKIGSLQELYNTGKYDGLKVVIDQLGNLKTNADVLQKNWNYLINEAFEDYISKFTGINITMSKNQKNINVAFQPEEEKVENNEKEDDQENLKVDAGNQIGKNYSKESVEDNGKNAVSYLVKRFLANIPSYDKSGNPKLGFMGVTVHPGFDYYYDAIGKMLTSRGDTISDYNDIKVRLQQFGDGQPWISEVIKRLDSSDQQLKNAFMYNFVRDGLSMKFVMYSYDQKSGNYRLKVYDTNAGEILRTIQTQWKENFKHSPLVTTNGENYEINPQGAQKLLDQFNGWISSKKFPDYKEAGEWLSKFGIDLSDDTTKELIRKGYFVAEGKKDVPYPYKRMFDKSGKTNGLFGRLAKYLETMTSKGSNLNFQENDSVNPFSDVSGILKKVANIESKYKTAITTNSFRDGDKTIFGFTPGKYATNMVSKLTDYSIEPDGDIIPSQVVQDKQKISFDKNSFVLNLLATDGDFAGKFGIDHLGINAFKELGKKLYKANELTSLSDADHELVKLGMFQDLQQGEVRSQTPEGLPLRMARMFFPTMSDKSTMLDLSTAVLNLKQKDVDIFNNKISDNVNHFLFSQLIEPELQRIISHHAGSAKDGDDPNYHINQKGYNLAAQIFNFIPEMNNMQYTTEAGEKVRLIDFLAHSANRIDNTVYTEIKNKIQSDSYDLLDNLFKKLTTDKVQEWKDNGYLETDDNNQITHAKFMDTKYLHDKGGSTDESVKMAAYDYVINSTMTNANMHMLVAGDIANFSQDKAFKEGFEKDEKGMPVPYKPLDDKIYSKIESDIIGVNLGKRLAMLIAPGSTIAQSKGDKYIQLFAKDRITHSENLRFLTHLYHGPEGVASVKGALDILDSKTGSAKEVQDAEKAIAKKFPDLAAYTSFESTDAQEMTTAKEHLDINFRQGRVSPEIYKDLSDKLAAQSKLDKEGKPIPPELFLSGQELQFVFQPHKPVVTGQMNDLGKDMSRMIYIKSSSFPLIPQVTQAFPDLNEIRRGMEDLQEQTGQNVRMSYDTANKVGSPLASNQIELWDQHGKYIPGAIDADQIKANLDNGVPGSALVMDRENFRIQQDVPFKSDKIDHQDMTTLGTQMMKEMFGDGVAQIKDKAFEYNGKKLNGPEMLRTYNDLFNNWITNEKTQLYDQIGVDESTGQPIDESKTAQKLQNILQQEAKKRGYPRQDIEALGLTHITDPDGNVTDVQFNVPLWLSPNSNRYEALLNAIVTNRLLNLDLPGASFVAGSEEGFKTQADTGSQPSRTIFTDKWQGSLQPASFDTNGKLLKAQVLIPSKFRDAKGNLLDLFSKKDGEYTYVTKAENGSWQLKPGMIDSQLLQHTSFRIPTSSHVSMSQIEVAGFLPPEAGDLMIVPKNFTKQKGLDFDVDKENMYMQHHTVDQDGKVMPLGSGKDDTNLTNYDSEHQDIKDALDNLKERIGKNSEITGLIKQYEDEIEVSKGMDIDPSDAKKFIRQLKGELDYEAKKGDLKDLMSYYKEFKDLKSKLIQNEIVKTYNGVLGSDHPGMQQKINKVLSTDFAEDQANLLDNMVNGQKDNKFFTTLSDSYQKDKMGLGAAGKMGIGVYSNYVVFHSLVQQAAKEIGLTKREWNPVSERFETKPYDLTLGKFTTDGKLGNLMTLDGGRSITDVNAERQNTATDNEKLQIMGKTNVNELTINVDATMSLLGFDKDTATINGQKKEISIPYFFMSQPIIKDYVDEMRNVKSNIAEFNSNAEADVITKLMTKYSNNGELDVTEEKDVLSARKALTGQKLADNITDNGNDGMSQQAVLHLFKELKNFGDDLTKLQSKTNIQRNGLGKSMFDMLEKYNNVAKLQYSSRVKNTDALIGDYINSDELHSYDLDELRNQGYVLFNMGGNDEALPFAVKPTTVTGSLVVHSAKAGYELWSHYFPHTNPVVSKMIDDIISKAGNEEISDTKKLEMQYDIFDEMKKYLYSSDKLGLFKGDPQNERERLFFDRGGSESLSGYLSKFIKSDSENRDLVANNKLISRFQYQLEKGILPSIIKYDNSKGEDFNEEYKYQALVELMDKNVKLPDFQGQEYTTRMLAKDLINYAYLEGGIQEAIQFVKYVPIPYLQEMGFADTTQLWQRGANGELFSDSQGNQVNIWSKLLGTDSQSLESTEHPRFMQQYFQHNPGRLTKMTEDNISEEGREYTGNKKNLENLTKFTPRNGDDLQPKEYIAIYNKDIRLKNKLQIYKYDGKDYNRIPTLGTFGMSEYSVRDNNVNPLIDNRHSIIPAGLIGAPNQDPHIQGDFFDLSKNHLGNTLQSIADSHISGISEMAKAILPYLDPNVKLAIGDVNNGRSNGEFDPKTSQITIDNGFLKKSETDSDRIAQTVLHEAIHSLTAKRLSEYFGLDGKVKGKESDLPSDLLRLNRVYQAVTKSMGPELDEFRDWYKENKGQLRNEDDRFLYSGMNIHEFTAMVMSEPDIQRRMSEIKYGEGTLLQKFVESIKKVLNAIGIKFSEDSATAHGIDSIFDVLDKSKPEQAPIDEKSNTLSRFGNPLNPSESDLKLKDLLDKNEERPEDTETGFLSPEERKTLEPDCIF